MRKRNTPLQIGQVPMNEIEISLNKRNRMQKMLLALKEIYLHQPTRKKVLDIIEQRIAQNANTDKGRPGMDYWKIFVILCMKHVSRFTFDFLIELLNEHKTLRQILGHGLIDGDDEYAAQTVRDNIKLFTHEDIQKLSNIVVRFSHQILGPQATESLDGSADSFVVETDVAFPVDRKILCDAVCSLLKVVRSLSKHLNESQWRKWKYYRKGLRERLSTLNYYRHRYRRYLNKKDNSIHAQKFQQMIGSFLNAFARLLLKLELSLDFYSESIDSEDERAKLISSMQIRCSPMPSP